MTSSAPELNTQAPLPDARVDINWRIANACALVLALLFTIQNGFLPAAQIQAPDPAMVLVTQLITWFLWVAFLPIIFRIARNARARGPLTRRSIISQLLVSLGVGILHAVANGTIRWALELSASDDLGTVIANLTIRTFAGNVVRFWLISAVYHAVAYHREVRVREAAAAQLAVSLARARLENLEARLHPHFLFNTLNSIVALIRDDPTAAEIMLGDLSELLRAALHAEPGMEVTLEQELHLLDRYLAIQQVRLHDQLRVTIDVDPATRMAYVPHLILQPIVENAIQHGIAPRESGGALTIRALRVGETLRLIVQDDGVGFGRASTSGSGFGISSTNGRLANLYGNGAALHIDDAQPTGTIVNIDLPFHLQRIPQPVQAAI